MKQKLGLVCALIHRPKVILLDEPTDGSRPGFAARFLADSVRTDRGRRGDSDFDRISG